MDIYLETIDILSSRKCGIYYNISSFSFPLSVFFFFLQK